MFKLDPSSYLVILNLSILVSKDTSDAAQAWSFVTVFSTFLISVFQYECFDTLNFELMTNFNDFFSR